MRALAQETKDTIDGPYASKETGYSKYLAKYVSLVLVLPYRSQVTTFYLFYQREGHQNAVSCSSR